MLNLFHQSTTIIRVFGWQEFFERIYRLSLLRLKGQQAYQKPLIDLLISYSNKRDVFVDIGAANGEIIERVYSSYSKNFAIEPAPHQLKELKKKKLGNTKILPVAVGSKKTKVQFGISETNPDDNAAYHRDDLVDYMDVDQLTLDEILYKNLQNGDKVLVKIDVQGYEYEVFRGARKLFDAGVVVVSEFWPWGMTQAGTEIEKYITLIKKHEYIVRSTSGKDIAFEELRRIYREGSNNKYVVADIVLQRPEANEKTFTIASNGYADGPSQALRDYLIDKKNKTFFITHPLGAESKGEHSMYLYENGNSQLIWKRFVPNRPPLTYIFDLFLPVLGPKTDNYVAFNNLAALKGLMLRRLRRCTKVVYWGVDFVPNRFGEGPLTGVYDAVDKFVCERVNLRVDLSQAALDGRTKHHQLSENAIKRSFVVPMGAWVSRTPKVGEKNFSKQKLVYMGHLVERQGVDLAIRALSILLKSGQKVTLDVVGGGPMREELEALTAELGIQKSVVFHGFVKDHKDLEAILASCTVALAPYRKDKDSFTQFADPGKLKAYLGAHLPIVLTAVPPNTKQLQDCGAAIVVEDNPKSIAEGVTKLIEDRELWKRSVGASSKLSEEFDWDNILSRFLTLLRKN